MGAFSYFGPDADLAKRVLSQAKRIARAMYSNPPVHGARIVAEVVGEEGTFNQWREEMKGMAGRIQARGCPRFWLRSRFRLCSGGISYNHMMPSTAVLASSVCLLC